MFPGRLLNVPRLAVGDCGKLSRWSHAADTSSTAKVLSPTNMCVLMVSSFMRDDVSAVRLSLSASNVEMLSRFALSMTSVMRFAHERFSTYVFCGSQLYSLMLPCAQGRDLILVHYLFICEQILILWNVATAWWMFLGMRIQNPYHRIVLWAYIFIGMILDIVAKSRHNTTENTDCFMLIAAFRSIVTANRRNLL